jgi:hypothetical protein
MIKPGDTVYALTEYNFERCQVVSVAKKNIKVRYSNAWHTYEKYVKVEKVAEANELVCIVGQWWKGDGLTSSRIERVLYPEQRVPANQIAGQPHGLGRVDEESYGALRP